MVESVIRLGEMLRAVTRSLARAGIREAARESRLLWAAVSETDTHRWQPAEQSVDAELQRQLLALADRRIAGEPLAHLTGLAGFRRLTLRSDGRALIPRPETEGLVQWVLDRVRGGRVADLGTGTGCIALSLADEGHYEHVIAVDRSREALALANLNRTLTGLPIDLVLGDWCGALRGAGLDAVVSNPPYVTESEYHALDRGVREFEPRAALASGVDGLADTREVLATAARVLRPGGLLALELDCRRAEACAALATAQGWHAVSVQDDLYGRARYLLAQRSDGT